MIYDVFHFNDELDLLDIRLNHHSQFVDKFVIIESSKTYTGNPKPCYFDHIKEAYNHFDIYHIKLDFPFNGNDNWQYEHLQRNIIKGFNFDDNDIILYSDCDEIIKDGLIFKGFIGNIWSLQMDLCFYYFNVRLKEITEAHEDYHLNSCFKNKFHMAKLLPAWALKTFKNIYELRQYQIENPIDIIENAGWHFSNLGTPERIFDKLKAISHWGEYSFQGLTAEKVKENKEKLVDPLGREGCIYETIQDSELPEYIIKNKARFSEYFR